MVLVAGQKVVGKCDAFVEGQIVGVSFFEGRFFCLTLSVLKDLVSAQ